MPQDIRNIEEICVKENRIFDGKILNLRCDEVRTPSGHIASREVVEHKPAVGMIAVTEDKKVLLVRQYRYAVHEE
ncbi:MAG: NUDIX hydrolase, partial [Synergistaceae bacterium]|nr:NUDIX hydrolase [Synergistaceae bacterium]